MRPTNAALVLSSALLIVSSCAFDAPEVTTPAAPTAAAHRAALMRHVPELGARFDDAVARAVGSAVGLLAPVRLSRQFDASRPDAIAYEFSAYQGRRAIADIESSGPVYADLYLRMSNRPGAEPRLQLVARGGLPEPLEGAGFRTILDYPLRQTGQYVLVIRPPALVGGAVTVRLDLPPSMGWPVPGVDRSAVWSPFGAPRDGGRRVHHGIDIFAPRGTPLVAVADGLVASVGVRDLGGNVVTIIDDETGHFIYYAHLTEQLVEEGQRVAAGDVIGTMGNTGNAVTTAPHLHIGVYDGSWGRPVDPWYYFVPGDGEEPVLRPIEGGFASVEEPTPVYRSPASTAGTLRSPARVDRVGRPLRPVDVLPEAIPPGPVVGLLRPGESVRVVGAVSGYLRVELPDGRWGYTDGTLSLP